MRLDRAALFAMTTSKRFELELAAVLPASPTDVWLSLDLSHLALATDATAAADRLAKFVTDADEAAGANLGRCSR